MSPLLSSVLATFGVSLLAFVGILFVARNWKERAELRAVSFAAGVLLATTFLDLLPEAVADGPSNVLIATLATMAAFYYSERLIHGRHRHSGQESHVQHHNASRYFILIGDGIHNFIDGVAIAASFLVSPELGWVTTLAVAAHELPHEIGDYAILVRGGYTRYRALFYNFLSGLTAVLGALATFAAGDFVDANLPWFLAAVAGMFLYIAAANLIPELHHQRIKGRFVYGLPFLLGIAVIVALMALIPHGHAEEDLEEEPGIEEFQDEPTVRKHEDGAFIEPTDATPASFRA